MPSALSERVRLVEEGSDLQHSSGRSRREAELVVEHVNSGVQGGEEGCLAFRNARGVLLPEGSGEGDEPGGYLGGQDQRTPR